MSTPLFGSPSVGLPPAFDVVVVAGSLGARPALEMVLGALPTNFPVPFVIVQHTRDTPHHYLPTILARHTTLPVREAFHGDLLRRGTIYTAPPGWHLTLGPTPRGSAMCLLLNTPPVNYARPAADPLFASAATLFGPRVLALVLSGKLHDATAGAHAVRAAQGVVIVQEPATCRAPGMPLNALGAAHFVLPPEAIATAIVSLTLLPGLRAMFGVGGTAGRAA